MLNIQGKEIMRGTQRIGYIGGSEGEKIYRHDGTEIAYVQGNHGYDAQTGKKLFWVDPATHRVNTTDGKSFSVDENHQHVAGGEVSDAHRAAIRFLLGE